MTNAKKNLQAAYSEYKKVSDKVEVNVASAKGIAEFLEMSKPLNDAEIVFFNEFVKFAKSQTLLSVRVSDIEKNFSFDKNATIKMIISNFVK